MPSYLRNPRESLLWSTGRSLELLLRAEHVRVAALLLAAIHRPSVEAGVALAANHLVAIVLARQDGERWLNDASTKPKHKVQRRLLLDVIIAQRAAILELLPCEDQALLIGWNTLLVLDLRLDIVDGVGGLHIERDGFTRQRLDEYLHGGQHT